MTTTTTGKAENKKMKDETRDAPSLSAFSFQLSAFPSLPTIAAWNDATVRAARRGVRLLIVAGCRVELIDAATGRVCSMAASWDSAVDWIERQERNEWRRAA